MQRLHENYSGLCKIFNSTTTNILEFEIDIAQHYAAITAKIEVCATYDDLSRSNASCIMDDNCLNCITRVYVDR